MGYQNLLKILLLGFNSQCCLGKLPLQEKALYRVAQKERNGILPVIKI